MSGDALLVVSSGSRWHDGGVMPVPEPSEERRRTQRASVIGSRLEIPSANNVQVLDISRGGVLLSSSRRLAAGQGAWLRVKLGGEAVRLEVEVCRASPVEASSPGPFRLGAQLLPLDEASAAAVETFLEDTRQ
jgi:hypothetical protein